MFRFVAGETPIELIVLPRQALRNPPLDPVTERPERGADIAELERLIAGRSDRLLSPVPPGGLVIPSSPAIPAHDELTAPSRPFNILVFQGLFSALAHFQRRSFAASNTTSTTLFHPGVTYVQSPHARRRFRRRRPDRL